MRHPERKRAVVSAALKYYTQGQSIQDACKKVGITKYAFDKYLKHFEDLRLKYDTYKASTKVKGRRKIYTPTIKKEICVQVLQTYPESNLSKREILASYGVSEPNFYSWVKAFGLESQWELARTMRKYNQSTQDAFNPRMVSKEIKLRVLAALQFWTDYFVQAAFEWDISIDDCVRYFTKKRAFEAAGITYNNFYDAYTTDKDVKELWDKAADERARIIAMAKAEQMDSMLIDALKSLHKLANGSKLPESKRTVKNKPIKIKTWDKESQTYLEHLQYVEETTVVESEKTFLPDFQAVKLVLEMTGAYVPKQDVQVGGEVVLGIIGHAQKDALEKEIEEELQALGEKKEKLTELDKQTALFDYEETEFEEIEEENDLFGDEI